MTVACNGVKAKFSWRENDNKKSHDSSSLTFCLRKGFAPPQKRVLPLDIKTQSELDNKNAGFNADAAASTLVPVSEVLAVGAAREHVERRRAVAAVDGLIFTGRRLQQQPISEYKLQQKTQSAHLVNGRGEQ